MNGADDPRLAAATARVDDVLITEELGRRPSRAPDHAAENRALAALAEEMAASPGTVLQKLTDLMVEFGWAQSAGASILEPHDTSVFHWRALSGFWAEHVGGTMPFGGSPCGVVVARDSPLLFARPHEHFPAADVEPLIREILLVPFHVAGRPAGTLWAAAHDDERRFDAEDLRILTSLARFAAAAHQMNGALAEAGRGRGELERRVRGRTEELTRANERLGESEAKYRALFEAVDEGFCIVEVLSDGADRPRDYRFVEVNPAFERQTGLRCAAGRTMRELAPRHEAHWFETYGRVALTGEPVRFENGAEALGGRWFDVYAFRVGGPDRRRVAILFTDITARRRAEAALRESEERLRALVTATSYAVYSMGPDWTEMRRLDGRGFLADTPGPSGSWLDGYIHPDDQPVVREAVGRAIRTKGVFDLEHRVRRADGTLGWTHSRAVPLLDAAGGIREWFGAASDVTARRLAEERLRESVERLRQFGEASSDVLWIRDAETLQWEYLTPAFEAIYGLSRERALGGDNLAGWAELILPEDRERAVASIRQVGQGHRLTFEYRIKRPSDGQVRWLRDTDFPIHDAAGRVSRIGGVGHDVTALKEAEAALASSETRLRTLMEGVPQLVWRAVGAGQWTWAGPQWTEHTGLADEASRGRGWLEAVHPGDRDAALAAWSGAGVDGLFQAEYRIRQAGSGHHHWFQSRGRPIHHDDGGVAEWLCTSTDIDDQVRAREVLARTGEELERRVAERTAELQRALDRLHDEVREREQAEERLRQSEKLKAIGQLTGGIAHDFNNMLQGVTSGLALVRARLAQGRSVDANAYIERAQAAAGRAAALTHRLLAFSRQQTLSPEPVNLDQVARGMEDMIRRTVGPAVQVELKLADGDWLVLCDPNQMESALLNLCVNARDAMPDGGWLTISTEELVLSAAEVADSEGLQPGRYAALAVTDSGTGMPPEVAAHMFEPFFTTKPLGKGTGLGLSQIYGFVRQSGGLVQVETAPGEGTTVRLCLPFHELNRGAQEGSPAGRRTLLLVEDEHDVREMVADQLRDFGFRVLEAGTGAAALRLLHTGAQVDALVTDVGLPGGMNGRQLAEAARERPPNLPLPVVFITGHAGGETLSGEDVVRKPFETAALAQLIDKKLG